MLKLYTYKKCGTCQKAIKFLKSKGTNYTEVPIREIPPNEEELKQMLEYYNGEIKKLFNTSGQDYRAMDIKTKLPQMSQDEALKLLSENGNLVKRPFMLVDGKGLVGFKQEEWEALDV